MHAESALQVICSSPSDPPTRRVHIRTWYLRSMPSIIATAVRTALVDTCFSALHAQTHTNIGTERSL